jgi:PST family polysaccharide transporter
MDDLKSRAVRGGFAKLCGQVAGLGLRMVSMAVMARLLNPEDFGLVAMATAVTGIYGLFLTAGLSSATVQRATIDDGEVSALFWINIVVGIVLALLCAVSAPVLVRFYHEPRLLWVTIIIALGFLVSATGVQHFALLERQLRYVALTVLDLLSQMVSILAGVGLALAGFGYWSLVAAAVAQSAVATICAWVATGWIPGPPSWRTSTGSMLRFGGTITLNGLVVYLAYNLEKVLLGRFWGADALGIYGRAYQLVTIPTDNLNGTVGVVAFSALSRLQHDRVRLKSYYLKGYSLMVSLTIPTTIFCALFADDIVHVLLGPKWLEAAHIFRLLTPTVLVFGMINPLYWLLVSIGLQGRSLAIAFVIAPLVISAYFVGLPYGPRGVATAYSAVMTIWLVPHLIWCLYRTPISLKELFSAVSRPLLSGVVAAAITFVVQFCFGWGSPFLRVIFGGCLMVGIYCVMLLFVMGQRAFYLDLLEALRKSTLPDRTAPLS